MILYLFPFISAAIGWVTNYVAIKMLFHPRNIVDLIVIKLHGIFPKRKKILAERLGKVVARDLFSMEVIKDKIDNQKTREQIKDAIVKELENYLVNNLKANNKMVAMLLTDKVVIQITEKMRIQLDEVVPRLTGQVTEKLNDVDIENVVTQKVNAFSNEKLEGLLMSVIKKELKFIELIGGVLGFFIGAFQVVLLKLFEEV